MVEEATLQEGAAEIESSLQERRERLHSRAESRLLREDKLTTEDFTQKGHTKGNVEARETRIFTHLQWLQKWQTSHCSIVPSSFAEVQTHLTDVGWGGPGLGSTSPQSRSSNSRSVEWR